MTNASPEVLLTEKHVAHLLGVKMTTLQMWRHQGRGPSFVRVGRLVRYQPTDVRLFIEENTTTTTSQPRGG